MDQQIELLLSRGMIISDTDKAKRYLKNIGYYRLSGYWYQFRATSYQQSKDKIDAKVDDKFRAGTKFDYIVDLYVFDKRLRLLLLDAIERIEIALRVDITLTVGAYSPLKYLDKKYFRREFILENSDGDSRYKSWLKDLHKNIDRSKEDFLKHFQNKYPNQDLPVWMSVELWDLAMTSKFLGGIPKSDLNLIATKYGLPNGLLLASWIRSISHVRNICAHHGRIWNRALSDFPRAPNLGEITSLDHLSGKDAASFRLYGVIAVMRYLLSQVNPKSTWAKRFKELMNRFPETNIALVGQMGFPAGWTNFSLWHDNAWGTRHDNPDHA